MDHPRVAPTTTPSVASALGAMAATRGTKTTDDNGSIHLPVPTGGIPTSPGNRLLVTERGAVGIGTMNERARTTSPGTAMMIDLEGTENTRGGQVGQDRLIHVGAMIIVNVIEIEIGTGIIGDSGMARRGLDIGKGYLVSISRILYHGSHAILISRFPVVITVHLSQSFFSDIERSRSAREFDSVSVVRLQLGFTACHLVLA